MIVGGAGGRGRGKGRREVGSEKSVRDELADGGESKGREGSNVDSQLQVISSLLVHMKRSVKLGKVREKLIVHGDMEREKV